MPLSFVFTSEFRRIAKYYYYPLSYTHSHVLCLKDLLSSKCNTFKLFKNYKPEIVVIGLVRRVSLMGNLRIVDHEKFVIMIIANWPTIWNLGSIILQFNYLWIKIWRLLNLFDTRPVLSSINDCGLDWDFFFLCQ